MTSEINVNSLTENIENCDISNKLCELNKQEEFCSNGSKSPKNNTNNNCDEVCKNGNSIITIDNLCFSKECDLVEFKKKYYKELYQFYQYLKFKLEKYCNLSNDKPSIKHVAHLEIEASKKKELENIVADYLNKRIASPNPFIFINELKRFIHDFEICDFTTKECN